MVPPSSKKQWFAVYTRSRAEKKAYQNIAELGVEVFLPIQKQLRKWSDRKKMVDVPLFSGYIFVHINLVKERLKVVQSDGVVKFVAFSGKIEPIQDKEIETIKLLLGSKSPLEVTCENFAPGEKVKVIMGSLKDLEGEIVKGKKNKIMFRITSVNQNILVEIPPYYLEKLNT